MGFAEVEAASLYVSGAPGSLSFEAFPHQARIGTRSASAEITDSAAAATAYATGHKVDNGVLSTAIPGDGRELMTLLEQFQEMGKSTGLVTTTYITHATPAAFGAHEPTRNNFDEIANDYLTQTRPDVLMGGGGNGISPSVAENAGYRVVTDRLEMFEATLGGPKGVWGQFGTSHMPYEFDGLGALPHLSEMTRAALDLLAPDPDGFFLVVEGGRIDHAGHRNDIARNVLETVEFARAVAEARQWAGDRTDTLLLVTADHETGGLAILAGNGQGEFPDVTWSTDYHTAGAVPAYAWGANSWMVEGELDNTDVFGIILHTNRPPVFEPIEEQRITVGTTVSFTVTATDPDGTVPVITATKLPSGAIFEDEMFTWTPGNDDAGTYEIIFSATDGELTHTTTVVVEVAATTTGGDRTGCFLYHLSNPGRTLFRPNEK